MESPNKYIKGQCLEMCPEAEVSLREREKLLHILEILPGTEKDKKPQADPKRIVKSFARSAAGKLMQDPKNLRPPDVLLKTVSYLFEKVISNKTLPWPVIYDFIMDRLRSVRQDMIIQNVSVAESICILQPIVRFYAFASYILCEETIGNFDPHINRTHLQECLKRLLCLYDECEHLFINIDGSYNSYCIEQIKDVRPQFEALYLVLNLGSGTALMRGLKLTEIWRNETVNLALEISINFYRNNFVKVCRLVKKLPVLLQGVVAIHLPEIRRQALQVMSNAYNSKNLSFPVAILKDILLYQDSMQVASDCAFYGLKCSGTEVQFIKTDFDSSKTAVQPTHLEFIDENFRKTKLSSLILNL